MGYPRSGVDLRVRLSGITDSKEFLGRVHSVDTVDDANLVVQGIALVSQQVDESADISQSEVLGDDRSGGSGELGSDEITQEGVELNGGTGDVDELGAVEGFGEARVEFGHSGNSSRLFEKCSLEGGDGLEDTGDLDSVINVCE